MAQELALALIRKNQPQLQALSIKVKSINQQILADFKAAVVGAKEAGKYLISMKDLLPHGHFERYVEDHTEIACRTARKYMQIHEKWEEIEDKLGPDAYVSTIDGCLRVVHEPSKRPSKADFPPTEVSNEITEHTDEEADDREEDSSDISCDPGIAEAVRTVRERRAAAESDARANGAESGSRTRPPKDPTKACEDKLESLFGQITEALEEYHVLKPSRLHFDCQHHLDLAFGPFRSWKRQVREEE